MFNFLTIGSKVLVSSLFLKDEFQHPIHQIIKTCGLSVLNGSGMFEIVYGAFVILLSANIHEPGENCLMFSHRVHDSWEIIIVSA